MCNLKTTIHQILLIFSGVFAVYNSFAQAPTYAIDDSFNTNTTFRAYGGVKDFHFLNDGRVLVGGGFNNSYAGGFGMIFSNGEHDNSWSLTFEPKVSEIIAQIDGYVFPTISGFSKINLNGISWVVSTGFPYGEYFLGFANSPYTVKRVWDIYQMENGDLLLGGAIANDTLLPNELRGISRIHADGSHDPTFPALDITPNTGNGAVHRIFRAPADGAWYISGGFTAINGHETNRIARLTPDFEVDTTFVSPFVYDGVVDYSANIILVDSQSRLWVSGYQMQLQENPNDTIQLIRLLPNGEVDAAFLPRILENIYPNSWIDVPTAAYRAQELINEPDKYIIYGQFNYFEDTLQPCITVVNDAGSIQHNYFQDQGATINVYNEEGDIMMPRIMVVKQSPDGSLLIGGGFSEFMGQTHDSVVKLKPGFVGVEEAEQSGGVKVYPNPADLYIEFEYDIFKSSKENTLRIIDVQGKPIKVWNLGGDQKGIKVLDTRSLINGVYFYELLQDGSKLKGVKFIIQH